MLANAAKVATNRPVMMVPMYGVLKRGCTRARNGGSRPSRAIDMKMRGWPSWNTSSTLLIAMTAPSDTMKREIISSRGEPSASARAVTIGSAVPSFCQGAMPVITSASTMYSTVHTIRLMMMPNGMSRAGSRASSAAVLVASKPM